MPPALLFSLIAVLGFTGGLRTLTPVAVLCWGAHLGWFSLAHTPFFFLAHPVSLLVFTVLALGEYIGDKLPNTPSRVSAFPLIGRSAFGAACGAVLATIAGAVPGGFQLGMPLLRRSLTKGAGLPDLPVALAEDAVAIGGALFVVSRF